ncbi:MAG: hypothetical protein AB1641_17070 [Thermodesulfobacteriota bacterium]
MTEDWLPLERFRCQPDGGVEAEVRFKPDSPWFEGHFPGRPILPGMAFLALIRAMVLRAIQKQGHKARVTMFKKVKFKRIVRPGENLLIRLDCVPTATSARCRFEITASGRSACAGELQVELDPIVIPPKGD